MYGKYFVGKRKFAVITLTGILLPPPSSHTLGVDNPMM